MRNGFLFHLLIPALRFPLLLFIHRFRLRLLLLIREPVFLFAWLLIIPLFLIVTLFPARRFLILVKYLERVSLLARRIMKWLRRRLGLTGYTMFLFESRGLKDKFTFVKNTFLIGEGQGG